MNRTTLVEKLRRKPWRRRRPNGRTGREPTAPDFDHQRVYCHLIDGLRRLGVIAMTIR